LCLAGIELDIDARGDFSALCQAWWVLMADDYF
jgi:hypothetical protein